MLIRFLRDFQSRHTNERFYQAGQAAEFENGVAAALIAEGAAEAVPLVAREGQAKPKEAAPPARPTPLPRQKPRS